MPKQLFKKGQSGNPSGRPKCKYDLRLLKDGIIDKFGGIPGFVNYWYGQDKRYLSEWLKEFVKKEVKFSGDVNHSVGVCPPSVKELIDEMLSKRKF